MRETRKVPLPKEKYVSDVAINGDHLSISFKKKQKIALIFICLNPHYWPYLVQVVKDAKKHFLPHHKVDILAWTDIHAFEAIEAAVLSDLKLLQERSHGIPIEQALKEVTDYVIPFIGRFQVFEGTHQVVKSLAEKHIYYRRDADKMWIETPLQPSPSMLHLLLQSVRDILSSIKKDLQFVTENVTIIEQEPAQWPIPTLMRYHLFLNEEERLKKYDSIFYLDADMRILEKISDEILSPGLMAAEHPMYSLKKEYIPPYEPNPDSAAYIPRPGRIIDENGIKRFKPDYYAGGFQGGAAKPFLKAMKAMKKGIDQDFNKNYTAVWNDESHWNKYLFGYKGPLTVLTPAYVYPDSLIEEYYHKIWPEKYSPRIVTITKPFSLSKQGADAIKDFVKNS